jgi:hypothetical protein
MLEPGTFLKQDQQCRSGVRMTVDDHAWPSLLSPTWPDTCATLHMWTQIVGKVRLALTPLVNHWWGVALYLTARGLTTSPIPYGDATS